jgi:hypothetical protein
MLAALELPGLRVSRGVGKDVQHSWQIDRSQLPSVSPAYSDFNVAEVHLECHEETCEHNAREHV